MSSCTSVLFAGATNVINGTNLVDTSAVYFTGPSGAVKATVIQTGLTTVNVTVPTGAKSGSVTFVAPGEMAKSPGIFTVV